MEKKWMFFLGVAVFLALGAQTCRFDRSVPPPSAHSQMLNSSSRVIVERGIWNGPTASVYVSDEGAALFFSCSQGYILQPLILDETNQFKVSGNYIENYGVPVEVIYTGKINQNQMILHHGDQTHELIFEGEMSLIRCQ